MRVVVCWLLALVILAGCARPAAGPTHAGNPVKKPIVTPETVLMGTVVRVNETSRFVVLSFPVGTMANAEQILNVYRDGLKVGEIKVTKLRLDDNTVADIIAGNVREGDVVRDD